MSWNQDIATENKVAGVIIHEIGHSDDVINNFNLVAQEGYDYNILKKRYLSHADRPEEKRNISYIQRVLQEIKVFNKEHKPKNKLKPTEELP